jgi:hypothetical protein
MERAKVRHDRVVRAANFKIGDFVLLLDKAPPKKGKNASISYKWTGPWEVEMVINEVNYALKSFHTKRILFKEAHQCHLKRWHGPAMQHAKFKTTKHREHESKSGKEVLNTQESNVGSQETTQHNIGLVVAPQSEITGRIKSKVTNKIKPIKRLPMEIIVEDGVKTTTRSGRRTKKPDFLGMN